MEQVLCRSIATTVSCNLLLAPAARGVHGSPARSCSLLRFSRLNNCGQSLASRRISVSGGSELSVCGWRTAGGGRVVGLGDSKVQRRAVLRHCTAAWLVACTAAMADTARAQPSGMGSDSTSTPGSLVFYNYPLAFNPAKAKLALEEKGLKYTEKKIDLFNGDSLSPAYLKLNPNATSPTLVTEKEVLTESLAIIKWADEQGTPLGGDKVDRRFVSEWLQKVDAWDGNLFASANSPGGGPIEAATKFKIKVAEANAKRNPDMAKTYQDKIATMNKVINDPKDPAKATANRQQLIDLLNEAERRLSADSGSNKFLGGAEYSAADAIFTPVIYRLFLLKKDSEYFTSRPSIKRYHEEQIKTRSSYSAVFALSDSAIGSATTVLPAVGKILFSKLTGNY